jgi:hypothetical protein
MAKAVCALLLAQPADHADHFTASTNHPAYKFD